MEVLPIKELIEVVGFPIAVCVALFWMLNTTIRKQTQVMEELSRSIDSNSALVQSLLNRLEKL